MFDFKSINLQKNDIKSNNLSNSDNNSIKKEKNNEIRVPTNISRTNSKNFFHKRIKK